MAKSLMHWLKSDVRLLKITEVEDIYRHNPFILTGYRDRTSVIGCLKSVLLLHNETINIWSHFLGFLFFVGLFCQDILWLIPQDISGVTSSDFVVLCTLIICYQVSQAYHIQGNLAGNLLLISQKNYLHNNFLLNHKINMSKIVKLLKRNENCVVGTKK